MVNVLHLLYLHINGYPADLVFFNSCRGILNSKWPLPPIPSILPIRILTRNALLLLLFRTTGTLPRLVHLTPLLLWARVVLLPWLLTASYSLMLSTDHLAPPFLQKGVLLLATTPANDDELRYGALLRFFYTSNTKILQVLIFFRSIRCMRPTGVGGYVLLIGFD